MRRFDYDLCFSDNCLGANSNTVQKHIYDAMGFKIKVPEDMNLPGINGKFYNGPLDDFMLKHAQELQAMKEGK